MKSSLPTQPRQHSYKDLFSLTLHSTLHFADGLYALVVWKGGRAVNLQYMAVLRKLKSIVQMYNESVSSSELRYKLLYGRDYFIQLFVPIA